MTNTTYIELTDGGVINPPSHARETVAYLLPQSGQVSFGFDTDTAIFSGNGNDLILALGDSTIVLEGYRPAAREGVVPSFVLQGGSVVAGDVYLFVFNESDATETASGRHSSGGDINAYSDNSGTLFAGLESLSGGSDPNFAHTAPDLRRLGASDPRSSADIGESNNYAPSIHGTLNITMEEDGTYVIHDTDILSLVSDPDPGAVVSVTDLSISDGELTEVRDASGNLQHWTFEPDQNFHGTLDISFTVSDTVFSTTGTGTLKVTPVNDAPTVADTAALSMAEDSDSLTISEADILADAADIDGDTVTVDTLTLSDPASGTLTDNGDGTWNFTPAENYNGTAAYIFTVTDNQGGQATGAGSVVVTPVNDAPTVADTAALSMAEDSGSLTISEADILAGAADIDGDTVTVDTLTLSDPASGTLIDNGNGTWNFTPAENYNGTAAYTFTVTDNQGGQATGAGSVVVTPVNDAPTVADTAALSMAEDSGSLTISEADILAGAADIDGDTVTVDTLALSDPASGILTDNDDGTWNFTPAENYNGTAAYIFTVTDNQGGQATGAGSVVVTPVNDAPTVADTAALSMAEDSGSLTISEADILAGAADIDGDTVTVDTLTLSDPASGILTDNDDGTWNFTPAENYNGTAAYTFTVTDNQGGQATGAGSVLITPVNDNPVAVDDQFGSISIDQGSTVSVDTDLGTPPQTVASNWAMAGVTVEALNGDAMVYDSWTSSPDIQISGKGVDADFSPGDEYAGLGVTTLTGEINDCEIDGLNSFTDSNDSTAEIMTVTFNEGMETVSLELASLFDGVHYDSGNVEVARIAVYGEATGADNKPTLLGYVDVQGDDDGQIVVYSAPEDGSSDAIGSATVTPGAYEGLVSVTLEASDFGDNKITMVALTPLDNNQSDSHNNSDFMLKSVNAFTGESIDATYVAGEDIHLTENDLLASDTDLEGDALSVAGVSNATNGTVSIDGDGNITFTPDEGFFGRASFDYTISDGNGGTDTATVTLNIAPQNAIEVSSQDVVFDSEDAGNTNMLGIYSVVDGRPVDPEIILADSKDASLLSEVLRTFSGDEEIRFFLIPDVGDMGLDTNARLDFVPSHGQWELSMVSDDGHTEYVDVKFDDPQFNPSGEEAGFLLPDDMDAGITASPGETFDVHIDDQFSWWDKDDFNDLNVSVVGRESGSFTGTDESDAAMGGDGDDTLMGEGGDDFLSGDAGNDLLVGGDGDDLLFGGEGSDTIQGGAGNDYIAPESGGDVITTGEGSDTLFIDHSVLDNGGGDIVVNDFDLGQDALELGDGMTVKDITTGSADHVEYTEVLVGDEHGNDVVVRLLGVSQTDINSHQSDLATDHPGNDLLQYIIDSGS